MHSVRHVQDPREKDEPRVCTTCPVCRVQEATSRLGSPRQVNAPPASRNGKSYGEHPIQIKRKPRFNDGEKKIRSALRMRTESGDCKTSISISRDVSNGARTIPRNIWLQSHAVGRLSCMPKGHGLDRTFGDMRSRQGNRCYWCCVSLKGIPTEVDHVIPLSAGGSNWPENLCLACRPCNRLKNQRMPLDFVLRLITNRCGQINGKSSRLTSNKQIRLFVGH